VEAKLDEGLAQAELRGYADKYRFSSAETHAISVVFERKRGRLLAWRKK